MSEQASAVPEGLSVRREEVTDDELRAVGVDRERDFPGAALSEFRRYPVLSEGGWFIVIKHQPSLRSVHREPWALLGPISLTSAGLVID